MRYKMRVYNSFRYSTLLICFHLLSLIEANTSLQAKQSTSSASSVSAAAADLKSSLIKTLEPADDLSTATGNGLFLLIPSSFNLTDIFDSDSDFNLFKLNTDNLLHDGGEVGNTRNKRSSLESDLQQQQQPSRQALEAGRMAKKMNLFRNIFNKPNKFNSPLYLINGTVCRFVSTGPICTTISTNGLPAANNKLQVSLNGVIVNNDVINQLSGLNQFNNNQQGFQNLNQQQQQQQPFQNQGQFNNNNQAQQFNPNNQNQQQQPNGQFNNNNNNLRPAGLMDDGTPYINVSNINNMTSGSRVFKSNSRQQPPETPSVSLGLTSNINNNNNGLRSGPSLNLQSLGKQMRQFITDPPGIVSLSRNRNQQ